MSQCLGQAPTSLSLSFHLCKAGAATLVTGDEGYGSPCRCGASQQEPEDGFPPFLSSILQNPRGARGQRFGRHSLLCSDGTGTTTHTHTCTHTRNVPRLCSELRASTSMSAGPRGAPNASPGRPSSDRPLCPGPRGLAAPPVCSGSPRTQAGVHPRWLWRLLSPSRLQELHLGDRGAVSSGSWGRV